MPHPNRLRLPQRPLNDGLEFQTVDVDPLKIIGYSVRQSTAAADHNRDG